MHWSNRINEIIGIEYRNSRYFFKCIDLLNLERCIIIHDIFIYTYDNKENITLQYNVRYRRKLMDSSKEKKKKEKKHRRLPLVKEGRKILIWDSSKEEVWEVIWESIKEWILLSIIGSRQETYMIIRSFWTNETPKQVNEVFLMKMQLPPYQVQ